MLKSTPWFYYLVWEKQSFSLRRHPTARTSRYLSICWASCCKRTVMYRFANSEKQISFWCMYGTKDSSNFENNRTSRQWLWPARETRKRIDAFWQLNPQKNNAECWIQSFTESYQRWTLSTRRPCLSNLSRAVNSHASLVGLYRDWRNRLPFYRIRLRVNKWCNRWQLNL